MTSAISNELALITKAITEKTAPDAIYLFGSYAYGQPHSKSDIDIFVVIPDGATDTIELSAAIRYTLYKKIGKPLDLIVGKRGTFDRRAKAPTLEATVARQGILIYGK